MAAGLLTVFWLPAGATAKLAALSDRDALHEQLVLQSLLLGTQQPRGQRLAGEARGGLRVLLAAALAVRVVADRRRQHDDQQQRRGADGQGQVAAPQAALPRGHA